MPNGFGPPPQVDAHSPVSIGNAIQWLVLVTHHNFEESIQFREDMADLQTRLNLHDDYHGKDDVNTARRVAVREFQQVQRTKVFDFFRKPIVYVGGGLLGGSTVTAITIWIAHLIF